LHGFGIRRATRDRGFSSMHVSQEAWSLGHRAQWGVRRGVTLLVTSMSRAREFLACLSAAALLTVGLGVTPSAHASEKPSRVPAGCSQELGVAESYGTDVSTFNEDGRVTFGGRAVTVTGADANYGIYLPDRATWSLWFRSWVWLVPLARDVSPEVAVDVALAWHAAVPDPGGRIDRQELVAAGWNEGAVTNRLETVLCLWRFSRDPRLVDLVEDLVKANLDELRYYGRPRTAPHNHGAMANFALVLAARAFDRPEWEAEAFKRFQRDFSEVFAECGSDGEQSAPYLLHNHRLWQRVAQLAQEEGKAEFEREVSERLVAVERALRALTHPQGRIPAIGDGFDKEGWTPNGRDPLHWWCQERGWAAGRDSWSDPGSYYTVRFGPQPRRHGHDDHGSLTWWVGVGGGTDVLVDRGNAPKDVPAKVRDWVESKAAHNVMHARDLDYSSSSTGTRKIGRDDVRFTIEDGFKRAGMTRTRQVLWDREGQRLSVVDTAQARESQEWIQSWHLDPAWRPAGRNSQGIVAVHPNGSRLRLECRTDEGARGKPASVSVKTTTHYQGQGLAVDALTVSCSARGSAVVMRSALEVLPR